MQKQLIILIVVVLLCTCPRLLMAQDGLSLMDKLERVTKEKEPEWTLDRKLPIEKKIFVLRWSSGEARVFMSITIVDSQRQAQEIYDSSVVKMNEDMGAAGTKTSLPNLGAQNQFWTGYRDDGSARLQLRQGKVNVLLFAPSSDVAKRFAGHVAALLPSAEAAPAAQTEIKPSAWKEFSSAEGRFSVLFPGVPALENRVLEPAPGVEFKLRIYSVMTPAECSVMYADYPTPISDPEAARSVLDNGAKGAVASVNSKLLELKEIALDGYPGRYLKERMPSGEIMRVKMVLVGQRLYQVAITTPREDGISSEQAKKYQQMAEKFLNSFKLTKSEDNRQTARNLFRTGNGSDGPRFNSAS